MILTKATAEEMAEHGRRFDLAGEPWPLVSVVWFERARAAPRPPGQLLDLAGHKPPDYGLWMSLARFFKALR